LKLQEHTNEVAGQTHELTGPPACRARVGSVSWVRPVHDNHGDPLVDSSSGPCAVRIVFVPRKAGSAPTVCVLFPRVHLPSRHDGHLFATGWISLHCSQDPHGQRCVAHPIHTYDSPSFFRSPRECDPRQRKCL